MKRLYQLIKIHLQLQSFFFKAATLASHMKKNQIAEKYYKEISNLYPDFEQINFVKAEIGRLENLR